MEIRELTQKDNDQIVELLEERAQPSWVEILYTRRPDPFSSFLREGEKVKLIGSFENDQLIGMGAAILRRAWLGGKIEKTVYLTALRTRKSKPFSIIKGYNAIKQFCCDATLTYTSILDDNVYSRTMLTKPRKRTSFPKYIAWQSIVTIATKSYITTQKSNLKIREVKTQELDMFCEFTNRYGRRKTLFPYVTVKDIKYRKSFVVETPNNEWIAAFSIIDPSRWKQFIVKKYTKIIRPLIPLFKFIGISMPRENENIPLLFLTHLVILNNNHTVFTQIIHRISKIYKTQFLTFSLPLGDRLLQNLPLPKFSYKSTIFYLQWNSNQISPPPLTYIEALDL